LDISSYRLDKEIIRETAKRIIDDFDFFGVTITFSGNEENAYQELSLQLIPLIENIASENTSLLTRIICKIDISEQQLKKFIDANTDKSFAEAISHLVIEREMQKVITRKLFK
jgi:hypothetical protein